MKHKIDGITVNLFGNIENRPIVFVHGFPYDHSMWLNQINVLKDKYLCVAYDIRGLGESDAGTGQFTMELFANDLINIINELNLEKPILCGLSMGGYISLRAIEKKQDLFSGLILCDTKSEADDNAAKLRRAAGIEQINKDGLEIFVVPFVTNCFSDVTREEHEEIFQETLQKSLKNNDVGVKGALLAMLSRTDTTHVLEKIHIPTLVICGSFDALTPPILMRSLAEKIPNSDFAVVPLAGHMTPLENSECFNDLITGFLKRINY